MRNYPNTIAVSGTHGKTTTSSMVSQIFLTAGTDPTISIGGTLPSIGGAIRIGHSPYFVAEACEYFDSFLKFKPFAGIILNVEADHLDYFKNMEHIERSFMEFAHRIPEQGCLAINCDIPSINYILKDIKCHVFTFGLDKDADWTADNISHNADGTSNFDVYFKGEKMGHIFLNVPGDHNISNSLGACAVSHFMGISMDDIIKGLSLFHGANRRFQYKGTFGEGTKVIDDFAHHPTEIKATMKTASELKYNKLWVVFQSHTYSRTKAFLDEFARSFDPADKIIVTDIYAAREVDTGEVSAKDLVDKMKFYGKDAIYISDFDEIAQYLKNHCKKDDLLITVGAGNVNIVGEKLVNN